MYRFDDKIKKEIYNAINVWTGNEKTEKECDKYFEDCCSIWDGYEEIKFYLEEDGEKIDIQELMDSEWCIELSSGGVMMLG